MSEDKIGIKGLGERVQEARKAISGARAASADLSQAAAAFTRDANALADEIKKHHDDLKFEAQTLGNSGASSDQSEGADFQGDGTKPNSP